MECADITSIPTSRGLLSLEAVMDWHSRYMLSWRLSNTHDSAFRVEALEEAQEAGRRPLQSPPNPAMIGRIDGFESCGLHLENVDQLSKEAGPPR